MLDLPDHPILDKELLLGGCVRLPLRVDADRLAMEVDRLPAPLWGTTGPRVGVHDAADVLFIRGYLPAEGDRPFDERPAWALLPYVRDILQTLIKAPPLRCLLARLPGDSTITPHVDRGAYFAKSLRIHIPVTSHDKVWMQCAGVSYRMAPGEVWALNNSTLHGVWNAHPILPRIHLICDFLPTPEFLELLKQGDRTLGHRLPHIKEHFLEAARVAATNSR